MFSFLWVYTWSGNTGSCGNNLTFEDPPACLPKQLCCFISPSTGCKVSFSFHSPQYLYYLFSFAVLLRVKWCPMVDLICASLMTKDVEPSFGKVSVSSVTRTGWAGEASSQQEGSLRSTPFCGRLGAEPCSGSRAGSTPASSIHHEG